MPNYNHFYDLPVYKTCRAFRKQISSIARKYFPKSEKYHLKAQVLDSSKSISQYRRRLRTVSPSGEISNFAGTPEVPLTKLWNI